MYVCVSHSVMSDSLQSDGLQPTRLLCPLNSPVKNTGAGSHSFLQGILSALRWNLGLLHCRQILYHLSYQGSPNYPTEVAKNKPDKGSEIPDPPTTAHEQRTRGLLGWSEPAAHPSPLWGLLPETYLYPHHTA